MPRCAQQEMTQADSLQAIFFMMVWAVCPTHKKAPPKRCSVVYPTLAE